MIKRAGVKPISEDSYSAMSAAVHATEWGMQYYGRPVPDRPNANLPQLAPAFNANTAFWISLVTIRVMPRPVEAFLHMCGAVRAPKSVWRSIRAAYERLLPRWNVEMEQGGWFSRLMSEAEERIRSQEPADDVLAEVQRRAEERLESLGGPDDGVSSA